MHDKLYNELKAAFELAEIEIIDDSIEHSNHPSIIFKNSNETHFKVFIRGEYFNGKSAIEKHFMVLNVIGFAYDEGVHAVRIRVFGTDEDKNQN
ncbi:hypothetical protein GVAV_003281 [Gurleya vavrai]